MSATPAEVLALINNVKNNPANIQRLILDKMSEASQGRMVFTDPGNPLILGLEMGATMAAASMVESAANTRKQYPVLAQTEEDLYLHMSDHDYIGRWSTPSRAVFTVSMLVDEILVRAVPTGINGVQKIVIPRHSQFTVQGYNFTMQYPIEIRVMAHGGLQIVYDVSKPTPLQELETNQVTHGYRTAPDGMRWLYIDIPVNQISIVSNVQTVSLAQPFKQSFSIEDNYYAMRAFHRNRSIDPWVEMKVTETDQVYDPTTPTMAIQVLPTEVSAEIPQVYVNNGTVGSMIRVDIYTTRGPLDMLLGSFDAGSFVANWLDLENDDEGLYSMPLSDRMSTISVFADGMATGGSNPIGFAQLRKNVIEGAIGNPNIPITSAQISNALTTLGYSMVKNIDNITDRIFAATRPLPLPVDQSVSSPMAAACIMLQASMSDLATYDAVFDNGDRITVTPDMLYRLDNGVVKPVAEYDKSYLLSQPLETQARLISEGDFIYSPFHYVYDITEESFDCRGYWLNDCSITGKTFDAENDTLALELSTNSYAIERTDEGFALTITTLMGETAQALDPEQFHVQLAFRPAGESQLAYLNGELTAIDTDTGLYTYTFFISSRFDVDAANSLFLTNFEMYGGVVRPYGAPLEMEFHLLYAVTDHFPIGAQLTDIDGRLATWMLPADTVGVIQETFQTRLGHTLEGMWKANRSVVGSEDYKRYEADVPWTYDEAVYELDSDGNLVTKIDEATGTITYVLLHNKGDLVYLDGKVAIRYRAGEVMHDPEGNPITLSTRRMVRQVDMFFAEGLYYFATTDSAYQYVERVVSTIVDWLKGDIMQMRKVLLEKSWLYFAPTRSLGDVQVLVEDGIIRLIPASQHLNVQYYLSRNAYNDADLRLKLSQNARQIVAAHMLETVVAVDDIIDSLRTETGTDVIALDVSQLGGTGDYAVMTMVDDSIRLSLGKRMRALADGKLGVEDDLDVNFFRHTIPT